MKSEKDLITQITALADVKINGDRPWDIQVKNEGFYKRIFRDGSLGFGEAYMDGWFECEQLDVALAKILRAKLDRKIEPAWLVMHTLKNKLFNLQTRKRAKIVAEEHYDVGNDLYEKMLDPNMQYTCAYWKDAKNLNEAQEAKLDLICRKLMLKEGMTVLDIGCGFGGFAKYAAEKYKVKVTGLTISIEQFKYAQEHCKGLPVEILFQDYRDVKGTFDRVLSIGMFEAVGPKNFRTYFKKTHELLADDGIAFLHTIAANNTLKYVDPWFSKYIFPNGHVPSIKQVGEGMEELFVMEDWHNFGPYYDPTLMAWHENFKKSWSSIKDQYSERFFRMWEYYLMMSAALFRARKLQLWQIVMTKNGLQGGYNAPR